MAIEKRLLFVPREKMFIRLETVRGIMDLAFKDGNNAEAMLYLASSAFMFRVLSEALPMVKRSNGKDHGQNILSFL